jgi:integrase
MPKLTKKIIDGLAPSSRDIFIFDGEVPRFGLRVFATGVKSYFIQYRQDGRTRRYTFAKHGLVTVDEARSEARQILAAVDRGDDPSQARQDRRAAPTVAQLCQRFMEEYAAKRCKPATRRDYQRSVTHNIVPKIGMMKAADVQRRHVSDLHRDLSHIPYQANRTLAVLSKMFNLAEIWGTRPDGSNPCRHVQKYREVKRERYLSLDELSRLGWALTDSERDGSETIAAITAYRLLILTGCRLGEIQTLKWHYVRGNRLELPDSKTGPKRVMLGEAALDLLASIPRDLDNPYVIAGKLPGSHLTDLQHPWRRIRARAKLPDVRIHDLRHSFASSAVGLGESLPMIGKLLGHTQTQTTARYAHLADDPVRFAADRISAEIARAISAPRA